MESGRKRLANRFQLNCSDVVLQPTLFMECLNHAKKTGWITGADLDGVGGCATGGHANCKCRWGFSDGMAGLEQARTSEPDGRDCRRGGGGGNAATGTATTARG